MDLPHPIQLPVATSVEAERATAEIEAAIELVRRGLARRVHVTGLGGIEGVAAIGLARAQAAGIRFVLAHDGSDTASAIVGPREA